MHGRREGEESKSLPRQHMCPVGIDSDKSTTEKVFPSLAGSSVPSDRSRFLTPSADYFLKDGREIRSGDCALFQAGNAPPFIGLVRWFKPGEKEQFPKLCVSWLYRPSDIKLSKGAHLNAAPNEVFYSFHTDVISSASILHPCKVAFLRKGIELPTGISSFVCRRVYDIENKCLWWLTDKDYINERQEEVDWLLERSGKEMHAAVQSGGRSPKPLNGPSSQQLKSGSDSSQNMGTGSPSFPSSQPKGKKRERNDQITEPANKRELRERSTSMNAKSDDADPASFKFDSMKAEITKMTEKGGLVDIDAVDKLVSLIQMDRTERKLDMAARVMLADVIAATNRDECLDRFVQLKGVPVLDDWLQEAQKAGKQSGDSGSPKEGDSSGNKLIEDLLLALLRALDKLPVNLNALRTCNIGKSVNHMKNHKNFEIQRKARNLVDTWKKRVDAEMKNNEGKMAGSGQTVSWQGKQGFLEVPHAGNRRSGSTEPAIRSPASHLVGSKSLPAKAMLTPVASVPSKPQSPLSGAPVYKQTGAGNSSSEPPPVAGEEKSTSSSQSQNNSHSCSSDHAKAVGGGSLWKEDARASTAGSMHTGKTSGSSSRHRRSANGPGSGSHKESNTGLGKSGSLDRTGLDNTSQSGQASEKPVDAPTTAPDHGNSHNRLILRIINPGRSPARGGTGSSGATSEDSPAAVTDKHENDRKVRPKTNLSSLSNNIVNKTKRGLWQSTDAKEGTATADEGDRSSAVVEEETGKAAQGLITGCSSSGTEKAARNPLSSMNALVESCVKYSEASTPPQAGDDMGMNLLASVAAGEISKSDLISSSRSPAVSPELQCEGGHNKGKATGKCNESASTPNEESKTESPMHQSKVKPEDGDKPPIASVNALKDTDLVRKQGGTVTVKQECEKRNTSSVTKENNKNKFAASEKIEGNSADTDHDRKEKNEKVTTKKETTGEENLPVLKTENKTGSSLEGSRAETKDTESKDGIGAAQGAMEARIKECSSEQINQETTSKAESDIAGRRKETSSVAKSGPDVATMLDFDLNEGVPSEDVQQCEPVTSTAARAFPAAGHMPGLSPSPFLPPASASSIHAPITVVAAPAKGSFVPPETLLARSSKGETGWKGSAATSAFRPAEPRKALEMQLGCASDTARASSDNASRQSRPPLEFDLNVADERVIEEEVSQSSAQTTGSSARGFDLDLNRADVFEGQENGLFMSSNHNNSNNNNVPVRRIEVPLIPLRPSSGFNNNSDNEANGLRDFDLNNGPGLDEAVSEPVQRAQITRNNVNNNVPFLHPTPGQRMNNAEIGNMSSWFSPGNSYPAVAIPSFLPDRLGEQSQPYPIVAAPQGGQRILGPVPGSGPHPFGAEAYRGPPVLSSPPAAMAFSPAAFPYSGFPFGSAFTLGSAPFAGGSAPNYVESSSAITSMFPAQLMGPTGASGMSSHYPPPRPYLINLPESSSSSGGGGGHDSSRRWVRQGGSSGGGLDLNSGPGGADADAKDDKMGQIPRQILGGVPPQVFAEEQARLFQMAPGAALKRKEPEGGWDPERSAYKFSWQ